jgi:photosystem II stability/assembly factor-like uncharacterized protein
MTNRRQAMKSRSRYVLILPFLALLTGSQVAAESVGPYGGWIYDMKEDGGGRILAVASFGGIYRSSDNAESWAQIYNGALIFDPRSVAVNSSGHIFVGSEGINGVGLLRSTDDGASWQLLSNALSSTGAIDLLVTAGGTVFACTFDDGLYRSTNNGSTFTAVSSLPASFTTDVEVTSTGTLFVGTRFSSNRMYRSTDNGTTWQLAATGLAGEVNDIFIGALDEIFATTTSSVYKTTDNGATWVNLNPPNNGYNYPSVVLSNGDIYAAFHGNISVGGGVYRSTDGGATWMQDSGLPPKAIGRLLSTSSDMVFAGGLGYGVYRRISAMAGRGMDWESKNEGLASTWVTSIAEDVTSGNLYAGTAHAQVFRSTDSGLTWQSAASGIPVYEWIYSLAVNFDGTVFVSGAYNGIYRSTDQGDSWTNIYPVAATALACNAQGHVFAGQGSRMYRSTSNGDSWTFATLATVQNIGDIAFDGDVVYAATGTPSGFGSQGVYRSPDNGSGWAAFNTGLTNLNVTSVAVGPEEPPALGKAGALCRIRCGTDGSGLFDLDESSQTWWSNPLLPDGSVVDLEGRAFVLVLQLLSWALGDPADCTIDEFRAALAELKTIQAISNTRSPAKSVEPIVLIGTNGAGILREVLSPTDVGHAGAAPVAFHVAAPYPNPFHDRSTLSFALPEAGSVRVDVFDVSGRIVRTLADGAMPRGTHALVWDGRNAAGRVVGTGVYFYRVATASETVTSRAVLAR